MVWEAAYTKFKQLPDLIICGLKFGPICQKKLKQRKSFKEVSKKTKLDNAQKRRGICFIEPDGGGSRKAVDKREDGRSWRYR